MTRNDFINRYRNKHFVDKQRDDNYKREFISDLKSYLKEEIGQYLNWKFSEDIKEIENDSDLKMNKGSIYYVEKSIDKYLERL